MLTVFGFKQKYYNNYENKLRNSVLCSPKLFYGFVNCKRSFSKFPSVMKYKCNMSCDSYIISKMFAQFFKLNYCTNSSKNFPCQYEFRPTTLINALTISEEDILLHLNKFLFSKSSLVLVFFSTSFLHSPDMIPLSFHKNYAKYIYFRLTKIFNFVLKQHIFLSVRKQSFITPSHKILFG